MWVIVIIMLCCTFMCLLFEWMFSSLYVLFTNLVRSFLYVYTMHPQITISLKYHHPNQPMNQYISLWVFACVNGVEFIMISSFIPILFVWLLCRWKIYLLLYKVCICLCRALERFCLFSALYGILFISILKRWWLSECFYP